MALRESSIFSYSWSAVRTNRGSNLVACAIMWMITVVDNDKIWRREKAHKCWIDIRWIIVIASMLHTLWENRSAYRANESEVFGRGCNCRFLFLLSFSIVRSRKTGENVRTPDTAAVQFIRYFKRVSRCVHVFRTMKINSKKKCFLQHSFSARVRRSSAPHKRSNFRTRRQSRRSNLPFFNLNDLFI